MTEGERAADTLTQFILDQPPLPIGLQTAAEPIMLWPGGRALSYQPVIEGLALLAVSAISRRLFDGKPSCLWVIGATALVTVTVNPALGLILGWAAEWIRAAIVRRLIPERPKP